MTTYAAAAERYFAAWNADGAEAIAKAVSDAFTADATYTDPLADVSGHDGIAAAIAGAQSQFPGFEFRLKGEVDGNHHIARFSWDLVSRADGSSPAGGSDVITLAEDGRIRSVSGFLDRVPGA
ncbi:nuclear transport factor 2 family protein [Streptomyces sp. TG1A-8]|uniref:nuclear transport factor 2 family protein n=1 Tax=Streptomyces sp. TG1A-8 TaxID=3051385 RepID=UPI00265BA6AF|nr:nuclear transport factor 2 family protein [Streptomyces sp. TG1A-8]MDO0924261.1 nuclear transport factor 2 family protein [Streptomyces sp. TG1A-8]